MKKKKNDNDPRIFCLLPRRNICFLTNLIDSYEGLGIVRTIGKHIGLIEILITEDTEEELLNLLNSLDKSLGIRIVDRQQLAILAKIDN